MDENDELFDDFPQTEEVEELPPLLVLVNAGFGHRSYPCRINGDSTMTIPDPLVRELDLHPGDELHYDFNEEEGVLYVSKKERNWEDPEWLQDD
jgi:hypothetical protein